MWSGDGRCSLLPRDARTINGTLPGLYGTNLSRYSLGMNDKHIKLDSLLTNVKTLKCGGRPKDRATEWDRDGVFVPGEAPH